MPSVRLLALALLLPSWLAATAADAPAPSAAPSAASRYDPDALAVVEAMSAAATGVKTYTMTLRKQERFGNKMELAETMLVKWRRPQQIYLRETEGPREGQEILYVSGTNKGRIKVRTGSFPRVTLNLDPYGNLAMAHAHHPVPEVSLVRFVEIVADNVRRARNKGVGTLKVTSHENVFGRRTVVLEAATPPSGTTPTLGKGQTLWDIARQTGQSMYVILHANQRRGWTEADHARPGDAVLVPEFYAGVMVLWVDEELHLPIQADLYDHDGRLYEHYEHRDLAVNAPLADEDFDPKNKAYHF